MESIGQESDSKRLFVTWRDFVEQLGSNYDWCIYDYDNDLSSRVLLEEHVSRLSVRELRELREIDERFRQITRDSDRQFGQPLEANERSWLARLPLNPTGELRQDLESLGLL